MRIDKYLQMTRIIKRRVIAKDITDSGQVVVNGRKVKPSFNVNTDDVIDLYLGQHILSIKVLETDEKTLRKNPDDCFEIIGRSLNVN
ncbi:MAG TPA: S4 domain-containing protein [Bacilli bacterium]|nr:S4 domain-containing protein [Bacilli bacterium]